MPPVLASSSSKRVKGRVWLAIGTEREEGAEGEGELAWSWIRTVAASRGVGEGSGREVEA